MKLTDLTEGRVEWVEGVQVWKNPSINELAHLVSNPEPRHRDLRGLAGRTLYVWRAYDAQHTNMQDALNARGDIYITPERSKPMADEWVGSPCIDGGGIRVYWSDWEINETHLPGSLRFLFSRMTPNWKIKFAKWSKSS